MLSARKMSLTVARSASVLICAESPPNTTSHHASVLARATACGSPTGGTANAVIRPAAAWR